MLTYFLHPEAIPGNMRMNPSTILKSSGMFKTYREMKPFFRNGKIKIRGGKKITSIGDTVRLKENMVIEVEGKGSVRVVIGLKPE